MNASALRITKVLSVATLLLLSACTSGLLETKFDAPTTYVLAPLPAADGKNSSTVDLAVGIPTPAPGLDTERIATLHAARRLDYYRDARWGATAASVVQSLIVASLQNQYVFRSVTPEQARVSATHLLDLQLRDFQAEYASEGATPTVRVTVIATVMRLKDRKLLASFPVAASVPAQENRLDAVVAAFESASQQAIAALNKQTVAALANDAP
jgi:ABC-type uncharacterized transport system auxiliary subunit